MIYILLLGIPRGLSRRSSKYSPSLCSPSTVFPSRIALIYVSFQVGSIPQSPTSSVYQDRLAADLENITDTLQRQHTYTTTTVCMHICIYNSSYKTIADTRLSDVCFNSSRHSEYYFSRLKCVVEWPGDCCFEYIANILGICHCKYPTTLECSLHQQQR